MHPPNERHHPRGCEPMQTERRTKRATRREWTNWAGHRVLVIIADECRRAHLCVDIQSCHPLVLCVCARMSRPPKCKDRTPSSSTPAKGLFQFSIVLHDACASQDPYHLRPRLRVDDRLRPRLPSHRTVQCPTMSLHPCRSVISAGVVLADQRAPKNPKDTISAESSMDHHALGGLTLSLQTCR